MNAPVSAVGRSEASSIPDVQASADARRLPINKVGIKEIRRFVPGLETGIFRRITVRGCGGSGAWKEGQGKNHLDDLC